MKIILSGGGTIGSVSPLLAVYQTIKSRRPDIEFLWVGTRRGPERRLISENQISFKPIFCGKLRRYFSGQNFLDPFRVLFGYFQSIFIVHQFKPDVVLAAGGFVSVPLIWAAKLLGRPALIHQQDVEPGLANKLMASSADLITVTFKKSLADFPAGKTQLVGNPVRPAIAMGSRERGLQLFKLKPELPTVLIMGGGTGARRLNDLVFDSLPQLLTFCQVVHLTGGKSQRVAEHPRYRSFDFVTTEIADAYALAQLVVSRAGMSALSELAATKKPTILIPISHSHQEANAIEFVKNNAALQLNEINLTPEQLTTAIQKLLADSVGCQTLSRNIATVMPANAADRIADIILNRYERR